MTHANKVVARVGGSHIYDWQLDEATATYAVEVLKKSPDELNPSEREESRREALDKLIGSELFYLEAEEAGFSADDNEIDSAVAGFRQCFPDEEQCEAYLEERAIGDDELRERLRKQVVREKLIGALMTKVPPLADDEVNAYYDKVKDRISQAPRLTFRLSYIESPDEEQRERFKSAFVNLTGKRMEDELALRILEDLPGLLPAARFLKYDDKPADQLPPHLRSILYAVEDRSFSPVYEGPDEISIFYMARKQMFVPMTEEEGRREARNYLGVVRMKRILDAYVDSLREKRDVEVLL